MDLTLRSDLSVRWPQAITGALCATALAIVLNFIGLSIGAAGAEALSAVWLVLVPPAAMFAGAFVAVSLCPRDESNFLTALMVWCVGLVLLTVVTFSGLMRIGWDGTALFLAGLACILGLGGAWLGASTARSRSLGTADRTRARREFREATYPPPPARSDVDRPDIRH